VTSTDSAFPHLNGDLRPAGRPAYVEFKTAVLEFSDDPNATNLVRYLNASRALEGLTPLPRRPAELLKSRAVAARFPVRRG
jgi:hypothetical protein